MTSPLSERGLFAVPVWNFTSISPRLSPLSLRERPARAGAEGATAPETLRHRDQATADATLESGV
jgi:hypothetical protein